MNNIDEIRSRLSFTNDIVFCTVMEENPDLCKRVVEEIIGRKIGKIEIIQQQMSIRNSLSKRNVCLDVYFEDEENTVYNIEMQATNKNDVCRRARFYQSKIDSKITPKGGYFKDVKDSYIIFICRFDPMESGLPIYTVKNRVLEDGNINYEDGTTKIFINASSSCRPELLEETSLDLRAFIEYCKSKKANSELTQQIDDKVVEALEDEEMVVQAMTVGEELDIRYNIGYDDGNRAGRNTSKVEAVDAIVAKYNASLEEACETIGISVEEYKKIRGMDL